MVSTVYLLIILSTGLRYYPEYLSCLFTCMIFHCFISTSLSVSTMVLIPKGSNKDLRSLIFKLFNNRIISSNSYIYIYEYDDLQFAYKKENVYCTMCLYYKGSN